MKWVSVTVFAALAACCVAEPATQPSARHPLVELAATHGLSRSIESADFIAFSSDTLRMSFKHGIRCMQFNGLRMYLNGPASRESRWSVAEIDARTVLKPLLGTSPRYTGHRPITVVLDPGHGGEDPGAVGRRGIHEKEVVLDIARRVHRQLRGCGAEVRLTRERDTAISLSARTSQAKTWGADLYVSIHLNSAANKSASGVETFVLPAPGFPSTSKGTNHAHAHPGNRYDPASIRLAYYVQKGLLLGTHAADRGIRRARYQVLRDAPCPAILVECGFVSNAADAGKLVRQDYRETVARGLANGILTFIVRAMETAAPPGS